jgi:hypothetical protein
VNHLFELLHKVCRTAHPKWVAVEHMGIDHGGAHILVPEEFLDRVDVLLPFQEMGGKGVAQAVAGGWLVDLCS